jgi:carbamoyl-phosphate synthase large subunit
MNVLLTSVGRSNRLVRDFRQALKNGALVIATDSSKAAPALREADRSFLVPPFADASYVDHLVAICRDNEIGLLVSRHGGELALLANHRERFLEVGTVPVVSNPNIIALCEDKWEANRFLADCGLATPKTWVRLGDACAALDRGETSYPVIVKPRRGSTSIGLEMVSTARELELVYDLAVLRQKQRLAKSTDEQAAEESVLIQERLAGDEYGIDVINDLDGRYVTTFVRRKVQMRGGNTDRAVTVEHEKLAAVGRTLGERLGHIGSLDCDVFLVRDAEPVVIDLNPRLGGGLPFSHVAGANLAAALIAWRQGETPSPDALMPRPNVHIAKYDEFVVVE